MSDSEKVDIILKYDDCNQYSAEDAWVYANRILERYYPNQMFLSLVGSLKSTWVFLK